MMSRMELYLTEAEARESWYCYRQYINSRGYSAYYPSSWQHPTIGSQSSLTREEADQYTETLAFFHRAVENISAANDEDSLTAPDEHWRDTPHPFPLTPALWHALRAALEQQYALYIEFPHPNAPIYREILNKLDTLSLAVYVAEAVENEPTGIPITAEEIT